MFRRRSKPDASDRSAGPQTGGGPDNSALVEAMVAVATDDSPSTRARVYRLLLDAHLVVMSGASTVDGRVRPSGVDEAVELVSFHDDDGAVLPVFTGTDALLRFRPEGATYAVLPGADLFQLVASSTIDRLALDAGSPTGGYVTRVEIEALAQGVMPGERSDVVAADTEIRIGLPAEPPSIEVLDAVRAAAHDTPGVDRAWLTMIQHGNSTPTVVIAVEIGDPDADVVIQQLVARLGRSPSDVAHLSVMHSDPGITRTLAAGAGEVIFER